MYVKFKKEHVAGFPVGAVIETSDMHGQRLVKDGFAEDATEKDFTDWKAKSAKVMADFKAKKAEEAKKLQKETLESVEKQIQSRKK